MTKHYSLKQIGSVIGTLTAIVTLLYFLFSAYTRTFDTIEEKIETKRVVQQAPSEVERYKQQHQLDTLVRLIIEQNKVINQNSQDLRDTRNHVHKIDSINKDLQIRTSDQVYQIKQLIDGDRIQN